MSTLGLNGDRPRYRRAAAVLACALAAAPSGWAQEELPPLAPAAPDAPLSAQAAVRVDRLAFSGNTAFTDDQLLAAPAGQDGRTVRDLLGRELTLEELEQVRVAITLKYVDAGYINSGAVIPDQPIPADGALKVEIVEGRLTAINLERATDPAGRPTRKWLRDGYLTDRIELDAGPPLNVLALRDRLELIRQDPHVKRINAELRPGSVPGEAALDVSVEENFPGQFALVFSNRRPPSVGAERFELLAGWNNVLGFGDSIALRYGINKGELDDWEFAGLDDFTLSYTIPITPRDTTLSFELSRSDSTVVEEPFNELDLDTESTRGSVTLRHPFYRTPATELAGFVGLSVQHTTNRLLGDVIDLSPGSVEGESNITALRFGVEYFTRNTQRAISVRSTFSLGVDAFEATINGGDPAEGTADAVIGDIPDGQFFSWLGQAQYVQRLGEGNTQFIARIASQLTSDPLLGPEQFAIGGFDTVRGYRENQVVRDNGVVGTLELRLPLISKKADQVPILELAPFVDAGYAFNSNQRPGGEYLVSVGLGLLFNPNEHLSAQVYWGQHLNDVNDESGNLQDLGIHFNIQLTAF